MNTYLIQRGIIENRESEKGIDSIVQFDYMGSSEYEFGALPNSLARIRKDINKYTYLDIPIGNKVISVFCKDSQKSEVNQYLQEIALGRMRMKERSCFDELINPSKHDIERQAKYPLKINFWWDIENDIMFWIKNIDFEKKFKDIIQIKPK